MGRIGPFDGEDKGMWKACSLRDARRKDRGIGSTCVNGEKKGKKVSLVLPAGAEESDAVKGPLDLTVQFFKTPRLVALSAFGCMWSIVFMSSR
jgi:hypothetical protein